MAFIPVFSGKLSRELYVQTAPIAIRLCHFAFRSAGLSLSRRQAGPASCCIVALGFRSAGILPALCSCCNPLLRGTSRRLDFRVVIP